VPADVAAPCGADNNPYGSNGAEARYRGLRSGNQVVKTRADLSVVGKPDTWLLVKCPEEEARPSTDGAVSHWFDLDGHKLWLGQVCSHAALMPCPPTIQ